MSDKQNLEERFAEMVKQARRTPCYWIERFKIWIGEIWWKIKT
jgi:hypothetical protein